MENQANHTDNDRAENHSTPPAKKSMKEVFFQPRVLVIDDEERIQKACERLLTQEGCQVDLADNGIQGLKMIEEKHFDIVLLDLMMPGISGMEVLSDVKSRHPDTVIIVITGYATLEHSIETMKKGAFDFLSKPFSPQELRVVIAKAIEFIETLQDIASEKSRMRVMINILRDGVLTTDHQKRIALANPAFLKMLGCRKKSVIGSLISDVIQEPVILEMIDQAVGQHRDKFSEITNELSIPGKKGGEDMVIGIRCIPFRDRLNRNLGAVTVCHDITALKRMDQLKSDFVSMVAHEIKSPLNSVLMQLKVVLDGLAGDLTEKQEEILTRSSDKIRSLTDLATELLDLSKIESGLINQEREELSVEEIIKEQVRFYREQADAKSIRLTYIPSPGDVSIMGNRTNIEEVLSNLISNAIRYTPGEGEIKVWASEETDSSLIHVEDNGFGIPSESLDQIFERFFRVKNEQTRYINGTGLGLAIVKSIVESHNGNIHVESKLNEGTRFTVTLPKIQYKI
ncbi:ATP-binding response regulator [Desulfospira joergensenii]|uniref:ATP-binding response regulator n=1 Tax=Desulfospira joergensenii TaxID=53329 RepID=UPI0003B3D71D|nr:response regulator [Desulfospira joergensenii]